jgi:hypothetical protein
MEQSVELMDVDVKDFAIFRTAGGIVRPHQTAQFLGRNARMTANGIEDDALERRKVETRRDYRRAAMRADG